MNNRRKLAGLLLAATVSTAMTVGSGGTALASVGNFFELVNTATDKCADVTGWSTTPGAIVHQWDCANDDNQLWAPVDIGNGLVQLVNRHSGLCMDVRNDMGDIQQYDCSTGIASESWQVVHLDVSSTVELISSLGTCLGVKNASRSNGAKIRVSECNTASDAQRWEFQ